MRILYSHYLADEGHPAACMVRSIADELTGLGHEVRVHASMESAGDAKTLAAPMAPATRRWCSLGRWLKGRCWLLKALARNRAARKRDRATLKAFRPDIVLARQDAYCYSMTQAAQEVGIPLVTYADSPVAYENRQFPLADRWHPPGLLEAIERRVLAASRAIITVSRPAADLLDGYRLPVPVHVVPNGVNPELFPVLGTTERLRRRMDRGWTAPRLVGFVGSFKAFHGMERLRDLILATAHRPDTQWVLIGDGPERGALESAVRRCTNAVFLGRQPQAEAVGLLSLLDIAVAPHASINGPFYFCPLKILESAAAGCAVLASNQGDIPLLLADGSAGAIVAQDRFTDWYDRLSRLLNDAERCSELGSRARNYVLRYFTWAGTARRVASVLKTVLNDPRPETASPTAFPSTLEGD